MPAGSDPPKQCIFPSQGLRLPVQLQCHLLRLEPAGQPSHLFPLPLCRAAPQGQELLPAASPSQPAVPLRFPSAAHNLYMHQTNNELSAHMGSKYAVDRKAQVKLCNV